MNLQILLLESFLFEYVFDSEKHFKKYIKDLYKKD